VYGQNNNYTTGRHATNIKINVFKKTLKTTKRSGQEVTGRITLNANRLPCPYFLSVLSTV
jgi:hypothetical protein